jgi:YHS domain-containing protein
MADVIPFNLPTRREWRLVMSKRDITVFLIGIACGGAVVGGGMLTIRPLWRVEVLATKPDSPTSQRMTVDSGNEKASYALDGYCPVTLIEKMQWTLGDNEYREKRGLHVFLFASSAEQKQFQLDPDRYVPAFSGNDVVLAKDNGRTVRGKRQHGLTHDDHIYLFATEESLQRFAHHPGAYVAVDGDSPIDADSKAAVNSDGR